MAVQARSGGTARGTDLEAKTVPRRPLVRRGRNHSLLLPKQFAGRNFLAKIPWKIVVQRVKFPRAFRIHFFHHFKPTYWEISLKHITQK